MDKNNYHILLYYCYTEIADEEAFANEHLIFCKSLSLLGRVIVAKEGLNGTVSGTKENCILYMNTLKADPRFSHIEFKIDDSPGHAFEKLFVRHKPEIVHSGLRDPSIINPTKKTGIHIDGKTFQEMKENKEVVVLDVRSNYEHELGKFKNALTLNIDNFREFPEKISEIEHLKNKTIITYCTGGIKCEKASALLLEQGFSDVYQLHGGIIKYGKETGGKDFEGLCYVFDNRVGVPVNTVNPAVISHCIHCGIKSIKMINCANADCNIQFVICEECGWEEDGCCSKDCKESHTKRKYDGTGYYIKTVVQ